MVATIRTLYGAISNIMAYFTSLVFESYYGSEREGVWHGSLAIIMGLTATVVPNDLMNLLCGNSPQGKCLQKYWDKKKKSGNELCFSFQDFKMDIV